MNRDRKIEKAISELVGVFTDPILVWPGGGWQDTLPDWIKGAITLERLIMEMKVAKGEEPTGTDAEALAYMYPLTLERPIDHDWSEIYIYLGKKVMSFHNPHSKEEPWPGDLGGDKLTQYQEDDLRRLKDWIWRRRREIRLERDRGARRQAKETAKEEQARAQPALFEF